MLKAYHDLWGPPDLLFYAERDFSPAVKRPGREADQSPPSSAEVMNENNSTTYPPLYLHGMHKDSVTFLVLSFKQK